MSEDKNAIGVIEYEVSLLVRRSISISNSEKRIGNLERSAYLLLRQLDESGPVGVKALADEFRLDISTVSRQTAGLEAKGLVKRIPDPVDGRASSFVLTEEGKRQLEETKQARVERYDLWLKDWTEEERKLFGELLTRANRTFLD
ncbi:MarR family transcriptional regulator [Brevibacillus fluminis]|uniref:MarR family transcriptional regulator n=1 Tax=Brevibacillus fluminis TaxID=511487 RepID=A0A3M8DCQ6_9BACL|nr:MarR family transcriptional regulator [Brevibacillus fluminis]RNB85920.1 MarR family transcriptional regulator [Brevibacillus fluminis]